MQTITITIDAEGATEVKVDGVAGPSCKELTKQIEHALGTTTGSKKTEEFYRSESNGIQAKRGV